MANKARANIVPVDIDKIIYKQISKKAEKKNKSIRKFVNELLELSLSKDEFVQRIAPRLSPIELQPDSILLRDDSLKKTRFAQIVIRNEKLWCDLDDTHDCEHVRYALMLPELVNLKDKLKKL